MEQFILLLAAAAPNAMLLNILPFVLIFVVFYLFMIKPMRNKQKKLEELVAALKNGDKVILNSGIYGVIAGVKERTFILKISDQVKIEVAKNAIAGPQPGEESQ